MTKRKKLGIAVGCVVIAFLGVQYWVANQPICCVVPPRAVVESHIKELVLCAEWQYANSSRYPRNISELHAVCEKFLRPEFKSLKELLEQRSHTAEIFKLTYSAQPESYVIRVVSSGGDVWTQSSDDWEISHTYKGRKD